MLFPNKITILLLPAFSDWKKYGVDEIVGFILGLKTQTSQELLKKSFIYIDEISIYVKLDYDKQQFVPRHSSQFSTLAKFANNTVTCVRKLSTSRNDKIMVIYHSDSEFARLRYDFKIFDRSSFMGDFFLF